MNQATFRFAAHETAHACSRPPRPLPALAAAGATDRAAGTGASQAIASTDRVAFDLGWDHAHHGLVPPVELLQAEAPITQGWMAGKAVRGRVAQAACSHTRQWLTLRLTAWRQGLPFDTAALTPKTLSLLQADRCPVTRTRFGGARDSAQAPVFDRINLQAGYGAGQLVVLSQRAAQAWQGVDFAAAVCRARALGSKPQAEEAQSLDAAAWWRLSTLRAFAQVLPFAEAARLPLAVLPPPQLQPVNAVQALQALVGTTFLSPGWSQRCREWGSGLPTQAHRHDFNLFVGALAPRVLEAGSDGLALRTAIEDAWLSDRVQRRWQFFVLNLGQPAVELLLQRLRSHTPAAPRQRRLTRQAAWRAGSTACA